LTIRASACRKNLLLLVPTPGSTVWWLTFPTQGFTLIFSGSPFPGHQYRLDWRREEGGGSWYYSADLDMEGWLCPALFKRTCQERFMRRSNHAANFPKSLCCPAF